MPISIPLFGEAVSLIADTYSDVASNANDNEYQQANQCH